MVLWRQFSVPVSVLAPVLVQVCFWFKNNKPIFGLVPVDIALTMWRGCQNYQKLYMVIFGWSLSEFLFFFRRSIIEVTSMTRCRTSWAVWDLPAPTLAPARSRRCPSAPPSSGWRSRSTRFMANTPEDRIEFKDATPHPILWCKQSVCCFVCT